MRARRMITGAAAAPAVAAGCLATANAAPFFDLYTGPLNRS